MQSESSPVNVIIQKSSGPGCLVQALWFIFVGWWLGSIAISFAWFLNITIIGLPLGMLILNNIPKVLALQSSEKFLTSTTKDGTIIITESDLPQRNIWLRIAFFILIGWWWSGIWLGIAFLFCATLILLPLGLSMFKLTPAMTTLKRY